MKLEKVTSVMPKYNKQQVKSELKSAAISAGLSAGITLAINKGRGYKNAAAVGGIAAAFSLAAGFVQKLIKNIKNNKHQEYDDKFTHEAKLKSHQG